MLQLESVKHELVPFTIALQALPPRLFDRHNRQFSSTSAKSIAYLYAQLMNKSVDKLSTEPIEWEMPPEVTSIMSSALVDSLQESLNEFYNIMNNQHMYNQFGQTYPSLEDFAKTFDSEYIE